MELRSPRLILRELRASDLEAMREYECRPETYHFEGPIPDEESTRAHLDRARAWAQESPRTEYRWGVTIRPDDIVRGNLSLTLNFEEIREWEVGWKIHYHYWGQGYATEAATAVLAYAFGKLHAHRVVAFCNAANAASARVMEKIGMRCDGLLREARWWNDAWADEYVYAILDRDWEQRNSPAPQMR